MWLWTRSMQFIAEYQVDFLVVYVIGRAVCGCGLDHAVHSGIPS